MDQESFIKELGRSYIVSSLLPATFFCLILLLLLQGFIPIDFFKQVEKTNLVLIGQWLLMSVIPLWIGFFLFSSVDWVVKLYEGYYFPGFLRRPLENVYRSKLRKKIENYAEVREILKKDLADRTQDEEDVYDQKRHAARQELQLIEIEIPSKEDYIMPTRLGNVLKASEVYALDRYLIEAITVWPRLFSVLPGKFLNDMEEKNNHFMFLLNSSLIMYIAGGVSLIIGIVGCYELSVPSSELITYLKKTTSIPNGFRIIAPPMYLFFSFLLLAFGYMLYRIAVNAAEDFCLFYRAGFDLYRMDLLKQLHRELPANLNEEKNLWFDISSFFAIGDKLEWNLENVDAPAYYYHYWKKRPNKKGQSSFSLFIRSFFSK